MKPEHVERFDKAFKAVYSTLWRDARWRINAGASASFFACRQAKQLATHDWPAFEARLKGSPVTTLDGSPDYPFDEVGAAIRICTRIAFAVLTEQSHLLRAGEERFAEAAHRALERPAKHLLKPVERQALPAPIANDAGLVWIDAAFASVQLPRAGVKKCYHQSTRPISVRVVDPMDKEIVYRLRRPDGGWLDVVSVERTLYRPVVAPRSWEPISIGDFAAAISSGMSWRDNPAAAPDTKRGRNQTDICLDINDVTCAGPPLTGHEMMLRDQRAELIGDRCNGLVAIEGIVHRPTPEPGLRLVLRRPARSDARSPEGPDKVCLAWECGSLYGWAGADPYLSRRVKDIIPFDSASTARTLPIELESALRIVASALDVENNALIATGPETGVELEARSISSIQVFAKLYSAAAAQILGGSKPDFKRADEASGQFVAAWEADDFARAGEAASAMRGAAGALVESSRSSQARRARGDRLTHENAIKLGRACAAVSALAEAAEKMAEILKCKQWEADQISAAFA